jgi:ubiquinone/menaquinone biosynthesis C-methylase UbiE
VTLKSRLYDHIIARRYDDDLAAVTEEYRQICIDRAGIKEGNAVLDLGCGTGLNQPFLASLVGSNGKIIGIDASAKMLDHAKSRADQQGYADKLQLIQGDLRRLHELTITAFDVVIATLIFSVVPSWREVFASSFEFLKPGGRYSVMDNYWPDPPLRLWLMSWSYAADPKRPGFEPLQQAAPDCVLEYHPPDADVQFYVAHGTKPSFSSQPDR